MLVKFCAASDSIHLKNYAGLFYHCLSQLVQILKLCDYRTLAIGDGCGNDVRMVKADIGFSICGFFEH
jgi:hypothetical protein